MSAPERATARRPASSRANDSALLRILWMATGPVTLLALAVAILTESPWTFTFKDGAFAATVVAMVACRYADVAWCAGTTAEGAPASLRHVRRFAVGLVALAAALWTFVQSFESRDVLL